MALDGPPDGHRSWGAPVSPVALVDTDLSLMEAPVSRWRAVGCPALWSKASNLRGPLLLLMKKETYDCIFYIIIE